MVTAVPTTGFTSAAALDAVYGAGTAPRVRNARVLVVGAGGVGCELVKNLACTGFASITLIDLDTIDVSNLNRQFLFRKHHVGKSKAVEAAASIARMVPGAKVEGLVGNIKEPRFGISFFKGFSVVCNALDNLEARRHVNRMCLAAEVPLVESGSTGYNGQCSVIGKGVECYDCTEKVQPKSYAVCTIRSTPDKPVHCVVWAKFLFELVFGPDDDGNVLKDLDGGAPAEQNGTTDVNARVTSGENTLAQEANGVKAIDKPGESRGDETDGKVEGKVDTRTSGNADDQNATTAEANSRHQIKPKAKRVRYLDGEKAETFSARVCKRVFVDDIKAQVAMKDLWKDRAPPTVYDVNAVADNANENLERVNLLEQSVWSKEKCAAVFKATLKRIVDKRNSEIGSLTFDKDDRDAMMFVAAASNLRSHAYGVPMQSPFAIKGIAGNIVHAIATTNAMIGGLVVLETLKIIANGGGLQDCKMTYVSRVIHGNRVRKILSATPLQPPNKKCFVCSKGQLHLSIDVHKMTLQILVSAVLQKKMSVIQPSVHVATGDYHNTLYECGSGLEDDEIETYKSNLEKTLYALRVQDGSQLVVEDFAQNLTCTLHVSDVKGLFDDKAEAEQYSLDGCVPQSKENGSEAEKEVCEDLDEDELEEVPVTQKLDVVNAKTVADVVVGANRGANARQGADAMEEDKVEAVGKKRGLDEAANGEAENGRDAKRVRAKAGDVGQQV